MKRSGYFILLFAVLFLLLQSNIFPDDFTMTKIGEWGTGGGYTGVFVQGNYAYCTTLDSSLHIFNISAPQNPAKVGEIKANGTLADVFISGNHAFLAAGDDGIHIFDVSDPTAPSLTTTYPTSTTDIYVKGPYLYAANESIGLLILDITNPASPTVAGTYSGSFSNVFVVGNSAYVIDPDPDEDGQLYILDISTPAFPSFLGFARIRGHAEGVFVSGSYAYVYEGMGVDIIDISNPASAASVKYLGLLDGLVYGVYVCGNYAYVPYGYSGLQIIDVSTPANATLVELLDTSYARDVFVSGNYAYVAGLEGGLRVVDISVPASPREVGHYDNLGFAQDVAVKGNYAYLAHGDNGLQVIDISNPSKPIQKTGIAAGQYAQRIAISGNYAYLIDKYGITLYVVDISTPASSNILGSVNVAAAPEWKSCSAELDLAVSGNYVYISGYPFGIKIIDASTPGSPVIVGTYGGDECSLDIDVLGNYLYMASLRGFKIIDVTDPVNPWLANDYASLKNHTCCDITVWPNQAFLLVSHHSRTYCFDISIPASPIELGYHQEDTGTYGRVDVELAGVYLFSTIYRNSHRNIKVLDISNPASIKSVGEFHPEGDPRGLQAYGGYLYVADGIKGKLVVFSIPAVYTLTVQSSPDSSAAITVTPGDKNGESDGSTDFNRLYDSGTTVSLTAAESHNGNSFVKWVVNGVDHTSRGVQVTMNSNQHAAAVFNNPNPPAVSLDRTQLYFAFDGLGATTMDQDILVRNSGTGVLRWLASVDQNWLFCTPTSGVNTGVISVSVDPIGLVPGTYPGNITISDKGGSSSQAVAVTLNVYQVGSTIGPFGTFETPVHGSNVQSSVPFTGWVLDDIGVESVKIYRANGKNLVYIGDGLFVEGARPDIKQAFPDYPYNYKAGWGYMMLTNFLPDGGNGTYIFHAIATDIEGHQVTLGTKTVTIDNANAVKPFGAIDTPGQGGSASGSNFRNLGWVLTPTPNSIPTDGSTIKVIVDGVNLGHPTYNIYRSDIATLFPGYANSDGALAYFDFDTTTYSNGVHTIAWIAADDAGNSDGIGSRYFNIQNLFTSNAMNATHSMHRVQKYFCSLSRISEIAATESQSIRMKKGFKNQKLSQIVNADDKGILNIEIKELEQVELHLNDTQQPAVKNYAAYLLVGNRLHHLPIGSTFDAKNGIFYWQPGVGFIGKYQFIFAEKNQKGEMKRKNIVIRILPKFSKQ